MNIYNTTVYPESNITKFENLNIIVQITGHLDDFSDGIEKLIATMEKVVDDPEKFVKSIPVLTGQFALVIESKTTNIKYLVADPLGTETLYYCSSKNGWNWSFDIKNILPSIKERLIEDRGLDEMMLFRWLMEEHTMLHGIMRVLPSHCVCLQQNSEPLVRRYSRVEYTPSTEGASELDLIEKTNNALDNYFSRLRKRHTRIAIFFSGGVDSSLLASKARSHNFERLIAVTCRFVGHQNPELERASMIAAHLGIEHRIVDLTDDFIAKSIPSLVWHCETPVSYPNNIARLAMFKSVAPDVDVVLTGEGADGMFSMEVGSAASALRFHRKRTIVEKIPLSLRRIGEKALNHTNFPISRRIKRLLKLDSVSFMREQGALFIAGKDPDRVSAEDLIPSLTKIRQNRYKSFYLEYEPRVFEKVTTDSVIRFCQNRGLYTQNRHQYSCYSSLAKEYGLIVAMPFLSGDILPIGLQLPNSLRSDQHGAKPILKKLTCRYLPKEFVYANKLGFEVPLEEWLSGSLYMWRTLLKEEQTKQRAIFDQNIVDELEVKRDSLLIWTAMVMEIFFRQFIDGESLEDTNNYWSKYFLNSQQRKSEINLIKT